MFPPVGRGKCSVHIWEQWLMLGPLGAAAPLLTNPGAWAPSLGTSRIKHLAQGCQIPSHHRGKSRVRGSTRVYQLETGTKRHFALTCSLSSLVCLPCMAACLWMCVYECVLLTDHAWTALSEGDLLQNNTFHVPTCSQRSGECYLYIISWNQRAKTWSCGDKAWQQRRAIQERINRKQHGPGHGAASQKD